MSLLWGDCLVSSNMFTFLIAYLTSTHEMLIASTSCDRHTFPGVAQCPLGNRPSLRVRNTMLKNKKVFPFCLCQYIESARDRMPIYTQFVFNYVQSTVTMDMTGFIYQMSRVLWFFRKGYLDKAGVVGETRVMMGKTFTRKRKFPHSMSDS